MVSESKREELIEALELDYVSLALHHNSRAIAERIVDRVIKVGWQWHPPKLEDFDLEHNKVVLTPHQEIDMMDRIISGLPVGPLYDVASLHPEVVVVAPIEWRRIPEFENYEMNQVKDIRNRWTKRPMEVHDDGITPVYVEMHDKEGFSHFITVDHAYERTFTN